MTLGVTALLAQLYLQTVRAWTPAQTGMFLLVPSLMMIVGNTVTVKLHKRGLSLKNLCFIVFVNLLRPLIKM